MKFFIPLKLKNDRLTKIAVLFLRRQVSKVIKR